MRQFTCPKAVTHPSTNRARCRATALIETNALPLHQTANQIYPFIRLSLNYANLDPKFFYHTLLSRFSLGSTSEIIEFVAY